MEASFISEVEEKKQPYKKRVSDTHTQAYKHRRVYTCSGEVAPSYRNRARVVQRSSSGNWTGVAMETGETIG